MNAISSLHPNFRDDLRRLDLGKGFAVYDPRVMRDWSSAYPRGILISEVLLERMCGLPISPGLLGLTNFQHAYVNRGLNVNIGVMKQSLSL